MLLIYCCKGLVLQSCLLLICIYMTIIIIYDLNKSRLLLRLLGTQIPIIIIKDSNDDHYYMILEYKLLISKIVMLIISIKDCNPERCIILYIIIVTDLIANSLLKTMRKFLSSATEIRTCPYIYRGEFTRAELSPSDIVGL